MTVCEELIAVYLVSMQGLRHLIFESFASCDLLCVCKINGNTVVIQYSITGKLSVDFACVC